MEADLLTPTAQWTKTRAAPERRKKTREEQKGWFLNGRSESGAFTTSCVERLLDIVSGGEEVWRQVKGRRIIGRHAVVVHRGAVEAARALTARPPVSRVHNVADAQFPQTVAVVGHGPVDGLGLLGTSLQNQTRVAGLHVTEEQVGPDFVHVVTKPLTSIQNIHQLFNRRTSSPIWTPVLQGLLGCF